MEPFVMKVLWMIALASVGCAIMATAMVLSAGYGNGL